MPFKSISNIFGVFLESSNRVENFEHSGYKSRISLFGFIYKISHPSCDKNIRKKFLPFNISKVYYLW